MYFSKQDIIQIRKDNKNLIIEMFNNFNNMIQPTLKQGLGTSIKEVNAIKPIINQLNELLKNWK